MRNTGFTPPVRVVIREREDGWCARCGLKRGTEFHHRRVKGMGGDRRTETQSVSNGLLLDTECHAEIHANPEVSYTNGWLVRQHQCPGGVPVLYRGAWVRLDDLGNIGSVSPA